MVHLYHLPAPANLRQQLASFCLFRILHSEPLKLALETKALTLGLDRCFQRRGFRRQFPPQLEDDLGQAGVSLGYRSDQLQPFGFGHVRQNGTKLRHYRQLTLRCIDIPLYSNLSIRGQLLAWRSELHTEKAPFELKERADPSRASASSRWSYWKTPVLFGIGFCVLQLLVALARFGSMDSWNPAELLFAIPAILFGLILFFLGGLLIGLLAQRLLRGVVGSWRRGLWVAMAVATPFAVLFSLVGGLLGPHMVVIGALFPYLLLVGIPLLIRQFVQRLRSPPRPEQ